MNKRLYDIQIIQGDITRLPVDAIVNAAAPALLGGGGVDGAIHQAAGPELLAACRLLNGCETGQAKLTQGFALPARWVIHTVGPVWQGGEQGEAALLASCYRQSLQLAKQQQCQEVAFPAISCGVYGYPAHLAAPVAVQTVQAELAHHPGSVRTVIFCCFDAAMRQCYQQALAQLQGGG